jgi:hypothetical protein
MERAGGVGFTTVAREEPHLTKEAAMKRAMVCIMAVVFLAAFASPVMAISPYSSDVKSFASPSVDCGNVVVTNGGTLIAHIDLGANNSSCAPTVDSPTTFDVCAVLNGSPTFITQVSDDNPQDGKISLLEGTKITVFGSNAFDFLEFRAPADTCGGTVEYTSGQPR